MEMATPTEALGTAAEKKQNRENSVATYMRREIDTIRILLSIINESPEPVAFSDVALDRLTVAARRLEQSLQYLSRGA